MISCFRKRLGLIGEHVVNKTSVAVDTKEKLDYLKKKTAMIIITNI
jgi:hypothetical protein